MNTSNTILDVTSLKMFEQIYPVGSIYISVNSTNPQSLFGGTWEQLQNQFLLAAGSSYSAGSTGGSATHTHTNPNTSTLNANTGNWNGTSGAYSGTSGSTAITTAQMPAHTHARGTMNITGGFKICGGEGGLDHFYGAFYSKKTGQQAFTPERWFEGSGYADFDASRNWTGSTSSVGSGQGHTHSIPSHTHSVPSHSHSMNHSHTVDSTGASSNMPPYLAVYMWKRTA